MNEESNIKRKINWMKIIIPLLIIAVVVGIYFYKKAEENNKSTQDIQITQDTSNGNDDSDNIPLEISSVDLEEIKSYALPFVIDFGSDSCIPCKQMAPVLETLNEDLQGKAIVHFVDVWKNTDAAKDFPVSIIPTQIFFNADGTPFVPSDELANEIGFTLYSKKDTKEHVFTVHQGGITEEQMRKIFAEMGVE